jgi:hypothetical protein
VSQEPTVIADADNEEGFDIKPLPASADLSDPMRASRELLARNLPGVISDIVQMAEVKNPRGRQVTAKLAACKLYIDLVKMALDAKAKADDAKDRKDEFKKAIMDVVRAPGGMKRLEKLKLVASGGEEVPEAVNS